MAAHSRLSALEAAFLALEKPGLPMHVAGVVVFDATSQAGGPVTLKDLRRHVTARLSRLPRYRQRVNFGWFGLPRPEWVDAGELDLDEHLFYHHLRAPGHESQLAALCARIHTELLPRSRPLWRMHLIDGLADGKQALVVKTHHSIVDGIAGIQVAEILFDRAAHRRHAVKGGLPSLRFARDRKPSLVGVAQAAAGLAFTVAGGPVALAGPFNGTVGPERAFAMATIPMDVIRRLKRVLGGSVNDVLLALVASGMSRQLAREHHPTFPSAMRTMLPVSTWPSAGSPPVGNHVTAVFVDLPLDSGDLPTLVRRIAAAKSNLRNEHTAAGMAMLIEAAGLLPQPLNDAVVRIAGDLRSSNLVLSDVPGPDEHLFFLGRPILACYPMIPLPPKVGLSVASVSMCGQMGIGIVVDPHLLPKPQRLADEIAAVVRSAEPRAPTKPAHHAHRRAA